MTDKETLLIPIDQYLKAGIHIGTKFKTKYMANFIYKIRPDGLYILNLQKIDERIKMAAKFLSQYEPEEILVASRRENSWKAAKKMAELTGIKVFAGRYPPGTLTNPALETYIEKKVLLVTDSWPDKNVVQDALKVGIPIVALCDTNNQSNGIDFVVPCNNKGKKALGLIFFLITREYLKERKIIKNDKEFKANIEDFTEE
ncbi:30S ribosomal protein S2 [Nanoarchaeota archaeon]